MVGTIIINLWAALVGFCIYFFARFLSPEAPMKVIINSFIFALAFFLLTFIVRALLSLIMYNPPIDEVDETSETEETDDKVDELGLDSDETPPSEDEAKEIANVVKTMMEKDN